MANITINDLVENRELGRHEMATLLGGLAGRYLFSFPLAQQTSFPSFPGIINIYNTTLLFAETIQLIKQDLNIINSDNVIAATIANTQSFATENIPEVPSFPSLPPLL